MSDFEVHPRLATTRCEFTWCTTRHGDTVHPDDETHRSAGIAFTARVRGVAAIARGVEADVEVGILRRPGDTENWLVIEVAGGGISLSQSGAAELRRILRDDPDVREALLFGA